jgi:hypothetical protein
MKIAIRPCIGVRHSAGIKIRNERSVCATNEKNEKPATSAGFAQSIKNRQRVPVF